jgi:hypothetical protein
MARAFLHMDAQSGIDGAMFHLKSRIASAAQHDKTLSDPLPTPK